MQLRPNAPRLLLASLALVLWALPASASSRLCATKADADPAYAIYVGGHSIWLPGIGTDFIFTPDPGVFAEANDGTARLTGIARRTSNPAQAFAVDLAFSGHSATIPPGGAHLELTANAYVRAADRSIPRPGISTTRGRAPSPASTPTPAR
ncbi:MAG: hypothetical protein HC897_11295 [Thermoanaerobaculia bacterium]|nr:hypothetical protein [Thermoanaerobaculia bacterium]